MSLPSSARQLLLLMKTATPGRMDVSAIPENELNGAADAIDSLFSYRQGLMVNPVFQQMLDTEERAAVTVVSQQFQQAVMSGRASIERLANGRVGVELGLDRVTPVRLREGNFSLPVPESSETARPAITFLPGGPRYVNVKKYWWGLRLHISHQLVLDITAAIEKAAEIVAQFGVPWWVCLIIRAAAIILKAFDRGNGVYFFVTWFGGWWILPA